MLRIRLTRTGKKHQPTYRIVVAEHTAPIKGSFVEILGHYIPTQKPKVFEVKKDRVEYWISKGATPSDTIQNLLVDHKILTDKRNIRYAKVKEEKAESLKQKEESVATVEIDQAEPQEKVEETKDEVNPELDKSADAPESDEQPAE